MGKTELFAYLQLGAGSLAMYILLEYVIVLDLVMKTCIVHPYEHVIDAQKMTQQHKETGGHDTLRGKR